MIEPSELRRSFDSVADLYEDARPTYPDALYEALIAATELTASSRVMEIGCAMGKATLPLARRGCRTTCVEPGPALAAAARHNLRAFPDITVRQARFEDLPPDQFEPFDLVFAATAWHWIDPSQRYRQAWQLLRPGGYLAFWSATHTFPPTERR
ncbi:class I SAM-dependent methyltransferase [Branchiibius cervicis]|uniref:Class I SAM-dependent methyltransferase n=1 Tax=Branchiibius cervicis TaxID=908252 RepID=A0ABW2AVI6_9MICO